MNLFGYSIKKTKEEEKEQENLKSFAPPKNDDGAMETATGGVYGTYLDLEGSIKNEGALVTKYREMALQPEADMAIDQIVNEAIVIDEDLPIDLNLDNLEQPDVVKERIREEFYEVLKLLDFKNKAYEIFRDWYIDGRIYFHMMINTKKPRLGIREIRKIDPRKIKKIRQKVIETDPRTRVKIEKGFNEFYLYNPKGVSDKGKVGGGSAGGSSQTMEHIKIAPDTICYVTSGIMDTRNDMVLSYLQKGLKPMNQLRMLEDAAVIYRLSRAPERRIFYIDVGNLPKAKAEQYLNEMMTRYKNKLVYNSETGEIRDDRRFMTMLEDFWLPRREGTKGTEIDTLPGGSNLGEMDDVEYFKKQLYKSLNIPVSRMESDSAFNLGRPSEITRDELHFNKFITRLRNKFSGIFDRMLETQLVLKGVINKKQWKQIREEIRYEFTSDNLFTEQKEAEILRDRIALANEADSFVGRYMSTEYVWKKIFRMTEEEIDKMKKQMKADKKDEQAPESLTLQGMEMDQESQQSQVAGMETDNKLKEKEADQPGVAKTPADRQAAAADKKKVADKNPTPNPNQKNEETETDLQILESINKLLNEINE
jgi:hypothetical protein